MKSVSLIVVLGIVVLLISNFQSTHGSNLDIKKNGTLEIGQGLVLTCHTIAPAQPYWTRHGRHGYLIPPQNGTEDGDKFSEATFSILEFKKITLDDFGNYTCHADELKKTFTLEFTTERKISIRGSNEAAEGSTATFQCVVLGYPMNDKIVWKHEGKDILNTSSSVSMIHVSKNLTSISSNLTLDKIKQDRNGSYSCRYGQRSVSDIQLRVLGTPVVEFAVIKAVGQSQIFLNWTIFDGNSQIFNLTLMYTEADKHNKSVFLSPLNTSLVITQLKPGTQYSNFILIARNSQGIGKAELKTHIATLEKDPKFVPSITVKGNTYNSLTVGWSEESLEYFHLYKAFIKGSNGEERWNEFRENPYMIENLRPRTDYVIKIKACSDYTNACGEFSNEVNATTMDGIPSVPLSFTVQCSYNQSTQRSVIIASWSKPQNPHGIVVEYSVILYGNATFQGPKGLYTVEEVGQIEKTVLNTQAEFYDYPPNTVYYLSVCAKTKSRMCGEMAVATCSMPPSIPNQDELSKVNWKTVAGNNQIYFMVTMPYISQRNGSVCCFRIVVVRFVDQFEKLESPGHLKISSYDHVHNNSVGGAYVAELLDPNPTVQETRIIIGDEKLVRDTSKVPCEGCFHSISGEGQQGNFRRTQMFHKNSIPVSRSHHRRHAPIVGIYDGPLNPESTYTAYLDAFVISEGNEQIVAHSNYFAPLKPTKGKPLNDNWTMFNGSSLGTAFIGTLLVAMVVVVFAIMCVMRWRRKEPGDEEYGLSHSLQQLCRRLRGQQWVPSENTVEIPAIPRDQIIPAFMERHKEEDFGFRQEFESLPDRFSDRSCHESDKRDNVGKNRYPDIKAYDQTRVRLSVSEGSHSSDYINANFVVGYKERKKFICAQGPMESTVVDWWRLIWEQRVSLILMLTNTEEYNKTKCAKYWPSEGSSVYGEITVTHNSEKEFSDYLVRNLRLKRSRPSEQGDEEREVLQYHYLVWKDFMAPEHPIGIIRFIKRFNEVYSPDKGHILVHCSAGVGRTGTLVALDSLLEQLLEENSVSIFNTICDLRHQRNFLVQSLKQYIFIYRALMEAAQFGDTEIKLSEFKSALEKLKTCEDGKTSSYMQIEFDKLSQVVEDRKSFSVGTSDENRHRNRHENVIPYDRNRVILSPMPSPNNEICTYINASFIEGYDNTEQFIMAQDPLEGTIGDFWRMIVEQNVRTIVMLSEVGDENCPRYWPEKDQETTHGYIKVKYMQSQSFPFYYKREFTVTDSKKEDSYLVTQFQYNGWPVGSGEVPESTRGLVELVDTTLKHQDNIEINTGPSVVHCSDGAQRCCIFVALAVLVKQMMTESRVDVFSVVRKLRSQRQNLFQNFAQYDLVYRGLLTYSELHAIHLNGVEGSKQ